MRIFSRSSSASAFGPCVSITTTPLPVITKPEFVAPFSPTKAHTPLASSFNSAAAASAAMKRLRIMNTAIEYRHFDLIAALPVPFTI